jgi:flagellar protein FliO/FliZ
MLVRLLLLILLLPLPLIPAEAPAAAPTVPTATQPKPPTATQPVPPAAAPVFSDAEWQRTQGGAAVTPPDGSGVVGKAAVGLLLSLLAIVVVAAGLAYAARKFGMRRVLPGRGRHLTVIETVPLGFKRSVSLLRIGDQVLVVGQGEHDLSHLATLPASILDEPSSRPVAVEAQVVPPPVATPPPSSAFRAVLDSLSGRRL